MATQLPTIVASFEQQAGLQPDGRALRSQGVDCSYGELNDRANRLAHTLIERGLQPGAVVAVQFVPGIDMVAVLLAIQKAGAAYVPIDPALPVQRQRHLLADTAAVALITGLNDSHLEDKAAFGVPAPVGPWCLDLIADSASVARQSAANPGVAVGPGDLLCILYTSGTTGTPKGVELTQANVANCLVWMQSEYALRASDLMLHKTPYSFDVSMYELFWPLMTGASVCIARPDGHRDPAYLVELIRHEQVSHAHFVPSMLSVIIEEPELRECGSLQRVFAAGEALPFPLTKRFLRQLPDCQLHNLYGPTEAGVVSHWTCRRDDPRALVPIGKAVANTVLYVLADNDEPVAPGDEGELHIGGVQLARGYRNQAALTAERFVTHPHLGRLYRSGDRVRELADGALLFIGRRDQQIKIRGLRIELGEIEAQIAAHPGIVEAAAGVQEATPGDQRLVAWFRRRGTEPTVAELRAYLEQRLPAALVPQYLLPLTAFPHLPNGKIDSAALPMPVRDRQPDALHPYVAPRSTLERRLQALWEEVLGASNVGVDDRFFESGGTSLLALTVMTRLRETLGLRVPLTKFYAYPTIASFATMLEREHEVSPDGTAAQASPKTLLSTATTDRDAITTSGSTADDDPVAIVGLACRVPGADTLADFWQLLLSGREGIRDLSVAELDAAGVTAAERADPAYVARAGVLADAAAFDGEFFGYTPKEAALADPQQRLLLECAWHALEDAGITPAADRVIGAYVGVAHNNYFDQNLASYDDLRRGDPAFQMLLGTDKDYAATRIAYKLNLKGPALTVQTACSTSGVALHLANQAIRAGDCDVAIVGGARVNIPLTAGYLHFVGGPLARDGHIRPFDAAASGMVLTSGVACLVLKRLSKAVADGDRVYALIRGTAVNNDGQEKAGFTAPSEDGQVRVLRAALAAARVHPATIGYLEAHGTGTITGDPIEVAALASAYASADHIALGSVKGNIGHLDAGAGAISVVKTALALHHRQLPASINCANLNPECGLERTPFFVNTELRPWTSTVPRRAGVSSFGFGGTNFHGVFEEGPQQASTAPKRDWQVLRLSAASDAALQTLTLNLGRFLANSGDTRLADVAFTLDVGRTRLSKRAFLVARSREDAAQRLLSGPASSAHTLNASGVVYLFPGQGSQHVDMGRELYDQQPVFRAAVDRCATLLAPALKSDLRHWLYPTAANVAQAQEALRATALAQPAIFTISYATACLWESWGLAPQAMIGHSLGEFVAATLAGVFQLEHALLIVLERGRLMQSMPPGGMLAIHAPEAEIEQHLGAGVTLAAVNAPDLVVVSGTDAALSSMQKLLHTRSIAATRLHTSHAFHSAMMDPVLQPFAAFVARFPLTAPTRPLISSVTGKWLTAADAQQPQYWARQLRSTVRFAAAVQTLLNADHRVFLELGPGNNLTTAVHRSLQAEPAALAIASLPHAGKQRASSMEQLLEAVGRLFTAGVELDPGRFYAGEQRLKVSLPGYPFARVTHWIAPRAGATPDQLTTVPAFDTSRHLAGTPEHGDSAAVSAGSVLRQIILDQSGLLLAAGDSQRTFLDLGFDSLLLTLITNRIRQQLHVELQFRQLLEEFNTPAALTAYLDGASQSVAPTIEPAVAAQSPALVTNGALPAPFGAGVRINRSRHEQLTARQRSSLQQLIERTNARTAGSKASAQKHRAHLADPRTASGFRLLWKELVYPIVATRSDGPYLWDVDGNRYIDTINGFGATFFGHRPSFVNAAVQAQLERGYEVGPMQDFIGEAAERFCRLTALDRVAFCNTGSEAVMAAMRCARTVTGRDLIAFFSDDYHGIQDEVLVRAGADGRSQPAASGVPPAHVAHTLILPYGKPESLQILRKRAHELAAIMVEPVQGLHPDLQPREFLRECRQIATESGSAFIMDEVITGFRCSPGGAQQYFGLRADLATYGKVFGGGLPVGAVAGVPRFMNALDGGHWQFGDTSVPESGVTYFAGTFVRHPLVMAAVLATLQELEAHPEMQSVLNARIAAFTAKLAGVLRSLRAPLRVASFSSLYRLEFTQEEPFGELLYAYLRERNLHTYHGRLGVMTLSHTDEVLDLMLEIYREAVAAMMRDGLLGRSGTPAVMGQDSAAGSTAWYLPPSEGARLGTDERGNPGWYRSATSQPIGYEQVGE